MTDENCYTITQVSKIIGYEAHVIRFYEKEFNLKIPRNKANHRYFTQKEIDDLKYIKDLQQRGFSNTQIKLILQSPEMANRALSDITDAAASHFNTPSLSSSLGSEDFLEEFKTQFIKEISEELQNQLDYANQPFRLAITGLAEEIKELIQTLKQKDEDIFLCENAKLKMQLKQKTYELAELREKLKCERDKNHSFLGKVFKK